MKKVNGVWIGVIIVCLCIVVSGFCIYGNKYFNELQDSQMESYSYDEIEFYDFQKSHIYYYYIYNRILFELREQQNASYLFYDIDNNDLYELITSYQDDRANTVIQFYKIINQEVTLWQESLGQYQFYESNDKELYFSEEEEAQLIYAIHIEEEKIQFERMQSLPIIELQELDFISNDMELSVSSYAGKY